MRRSRPSGGIRRTPAARLTRSAILFLALLGAQPPVALPQEVRAGAFVFRFWPGQERLAETLALTVQPPPAMPGLPADILAAGEIVIYLPPDRKAFESLAPGAPDWSAGLAFPEGDRIVLPTFNYRAGAQLVTVLRHELAHVALGRYLGPVAPRWFHEGYAQFAAGSWRAENAWSLRVAIFLGRFPSLQSLSLDFQRNRLNVEHAYLLSYTVVEYLHRLGGPDGFAALLERWRSTGDLDRALRTTYGITLGQFERLWRQDVSSRFGWLLVLGQTAVYWTLLTILLLVMGYFKKRRNRHKLAALDEAARSAADPEGAWQEYGEQDHNQAMIDADE